MKSLLVIAVFAILMAYKSFLNLCLFFADALEFIGLNDDAMALELWVEGKAEEVVFAISRAKQRLKP
jgi:hypothetical protein